MTKAEGLNRYIEAQNPLYAEVLSELRAGRKRSHWMWFIFPQLIGLGHSPTSVYFAIRSLDEARRYLHHPILGPRLLECTQAVISVEGSPITEIFGFPDDLKFRSCMTLFSRVSDPGSVFEKALDRYFEGKVDLRTQELLGMN